VATVSGLVPRLLGDWFEPEFLLRTAHLIRVEDFLGDTEYRVRAELPGLDPEKDIKVTVDHGVLTIYAERTDEVQSRNRTEFRYGALQRLVRLPAGADEEHVAASYTKGILEITVPVTRPEPTRRQIPVTTAG
jgi:HSP20 family protein